MNKNVKVVCISKKGLTHAGVRHTLPSEKTFSEGLKQGFEVGLDAGRALCKSGTCAAHSKADADLISTKDLKVKPFFASKGGEAPKKEAPKKEAPKKEAPKKEAPKKEASMKAEVKKENKGK